MIPRRPSRAAGILIALAAGIAFVLLTASAGVALGAPNVTGDSFVFPARLTSKVTAVKTPAPGSGGWYWPLGTEKFADYGHFMQDRGGNWHLAQDMAGRAHQPVYAVGDGVVLESGNVSGFGPGGSSGGAMVILHTSAAGKQFKALYGHIEGMRYKKGQSVKAGALIALLNEFNPAHLHFGINPGKAYPSDRNPWRGHTYVKSQTYGWVDPVKFLRDNPRVSQYAAPAWPLVGSIEASAKPVAAWAAAGWMYWTMKAPIASDADATKTWATRLPTKRHRSDSTTGSPMAADTVRYRTSVVSSPTVCVRIQDRLPRLSLSVSTTRPKAGKAFVSLGRLCNAADKPFVRAPVVLERRVGAKWKTIAVVLTDRNGRWAATWATPDSRTLRARFASPAGAAPVYMPAASPSVSVTAR